ncbi:hypothetical protein CMO83_05155 [Candidatus Woesearchaeota archaeon]|mgnify:CR=1 FL=1|jgi:hypothetical protein|nr:hypothetical protein [Candidatus Woesearchaeota archaeon]|tara:strand:- start:21449 stop:22780 length:1332 start_codon:yes stop_codon:yes gene_type:complete
MPQQKRTLKRSMTGFEVELFTINRKGMMVDMADKLLKKARSDKNLAVKEEIGLNQIEIACLPNEKIPNAMDNLLKEVEYLVSIAEKEDTLLCPLGNYPGKINPDMRSTPKYDIKRDIIGKERYKIEARAIGFHSHYTLPRGIFDFELRVLKLLVKSKIKDSFVNSYNFLIAADPALTCFMQSSPFYQGKHIGKDSRMIMYRGGPHLNNKSGLYANFEEFGGLPPYKATALDIMDIITTRFEKWKSYIKALGLNIKVLSTYGSILYTTWAPIRVTPHGTLEQRGMDMNHPIYIAGIGTIIKHLLKKMQEEFYTVVPSEIGIKEPFKVEGDTIYIPPYPYVRNELQKLSAYKGLDSPIILDYCKRFLKLASSTMPKDRLKLIEPFKEMINKKKTVSDEILDFAKKRGFRKNSELSNKLAAEIALNHSERLFREIIFTRNLIKDMN